MNINVKIGWKFIIIELVVLFLFIILIDVYMIVKHNSTTKKYYSGDFKGLVKELKRLQSISDIFSKNPRNKNREMIFNTTCIFLASISLLNDDENGFILELNKVKNEKRCEIKPFMLSLFFKSKNSTQNAEMYYQIFRNCEHSNKSMIVVTNYLFVNEDTTTIEEFTNAVNTFRNPAIIKLLDTIRGQGSTEDRFLS